MVLFREKGNCLFFQVMIKWACCSPKREKSKKRKRKVIEEMNWKKPISLVLSLALAASLAAPALADEKPAGWTPADGARVEEPWYAEAQTYVTERGIMIGTDKGFEPDKIVTRAEVFQALYNMEKPELATTSIPFPDTEGKWYDAAANWAGAAQIAKGDETGAFNGDRAMTRAEMATAIYRWVQSKGQGFTGSWMFLLDFDDADQVPQWADEAMHWMTMKKIINGKGSERTLACQETATRAELAQMLMKLDKSLTPYEETAVAYEDDGRTVPAVVTMPKNVEGKVPAVVMAHGHGGSKDENVGFPGIARALAAAGIATIRMDFPGCGESTEPFTENTLRNMKSDVTAGLAYLEANYNVDPDRVGILGYSMGGRIAMELVTADDNPYSAVYILSGVSTPGEVCIAGLLPEGTTQADAEKQAKETGSFDYTTQYGQNLSLSAEWFEDMMIDPLKDADKYTGPMIVVHGDLDTVVDDATNKLTVATFAGAQEVIVPGADHGYGFYSDQPEVTAVVEGKAVEFFTLGLYPAVSLEDYLKDGGEDWFLTGKTEYTVQGMMVSKETSFHNDLEVTDYTVTDDGVSVVLKGTLGEQWVSKLEKVAKTYTTADGGAITADTFAQKDTFVDLKTVSELGTNFAMFVPADLSVTVNTAWGDVLHTNLPNAPHGEGDYLVCRVGEDGQPDLSDVWVVNGAQFPNTYDLSHKGITGKAVAASKYGNVTTDIPMDSLTAVGFEVGDILKVEITGQEPMMVPFGTGYSNVDTGSPIAVTDTSTNTLALAINMGNFASTYALGTQAEDKSWTMDETKTVTVSMGEKAGYLEEYTIRNIDALRTNVREDYESDEVFANFRAVTMGDIADGKLYRGSSPVNPELGRNTYVDALLKANNVKTVIDLADSEEEYAGYEGVAESYACTTDTVKLNMGVDFAAEDFAAKLKTGLEFMIAHEGPYFVHCNEGKDRCGFVTMVLEMLMGGKADEIVDDYMLSYENYYHVEHDSDRWNRIAGSNVIANMLKLTGAEDQAALAKADLVKAAETYLTETVGLTADQVTALKTVLSK